MSKAAESLPTIDKTWRSSVPILSAFEKIRIQASRYPYVEQSSAEEMFFLRGATCHPRLSEFPQCKAVIRDYYLCRDDFPALQMFNICGPLKEELCACLNMVFVKNQKKVSAKATAVRKEKQAEMKRHEARSIVDKKQTVEDSRTKFLD